MAKYNYGYVYETMGRVEADSEEEAKQLIIDEILDTAHDSIVMWFDDPGGEIDKPD